MAENETIDGFKRNLGLLVQALASERAGSLRKEIETLDSWKAWVSRGHACTQQHIDHWYFVVVPGALRTILRRKNLNAIDFAAATAFFRYALESSAINITKGLDTDKYFQMILDPEHPFWTTAIDRPLPAGQSETDAESKATIALVADGKAPDCPPRPILASATSEDDLVATLGASFAEQLRIGDVADFRGPKSEFVWVSVTVLETSPFGDVIHLSVPLTGSTFWVAVEASDQHWAPCGEKATGQLPPSSKSIPVDDAALRAAEEAAVLRILQTQKLDFRNELKRGRLLDARHKVDGLWYQAMVVDEKPADDASIAFLKAVLAPLNVSASVSPSIASLACYVKVTLLGCGHQSDDWLPRYSSQLAPLNWRSGGARGTVVQLPAVEWEQEREMAPRDVPDPKTLHKSPSFVELFNLMWLRSAEEHVFAHLLRRLKKDVATKPSGVSFSWISDTMSMLGKNADIFTDVSLEAFVRPLWNCAEAYLNQLDDEGVRSIPGKESIDSLVLGVRRILRRLYPTPAAAALRAETLMLDVALRCCKSSQLMKRRDGLRVLGDAVQIAVNRERYIYGYFESSGFLAGSSVPISEYQRMPVAVAIKSASIAQMVSENLLLHDIFVARHHRELIKMSGDLLRVVSNYPELLGPSQVAWILDAIRHSDTDDVDAACSVLNEVRSDLPAKVWRQLLQQLIHPSEGPLPVDSMGSPDVVGVSKAPGSSASDACSCPAVSFSTVRLLLSAAQSQMTSPIDLSSESAPEASVLVREAIGDLLCVSLRLHPAGRLEDAEAHLEVVPASVAEFAATELTNLLRAYHLRPLRQPVMRTCVRLVQRHIRVHRCLALLRGVINFYPERRPEPPAPSEGASDVVMSTSPSTPLGDADSCAADILSMLEAPSLNQVGSLLVHLQVFGAAARRQAKEMSLVTWDLYTGTGDDSSATDASEKESGVARSMSDASTDDIGSPLACARNLEEALLSASVIDDLNIFITEEDKKSIQPSSEFTRFVSRGGADTAAPINLGNWQVTDAAILGRRTTRALDLSWIAGASKVSVSDSGDAVSFFEGIAVILEYLAFVLLRGERCFTLAEALTLWREVVTTALTPSERTRGLSWFTQALLVLAASEGSTTRQALTKELAATIGVDKGRASDTATHLVIKPDVALTLFTERLTNPSQVAALCDDAAGFGCWRAFFLYANGKHGNLSHSGFNLAALGSASVTDADSDTEDAAEIVKSVAAYFASSLPAPTSIRGGGIGGDFHVLQASGCLGGVLKDRNFIMTESLALQLDLDGLDVLWFLALHATDATVAAAAITFLTLLNQRLSDELTPRIVEFRKRYLERCMAYIAAAASRKSVGTPFIPGSKLGWPWAPEATTAAVAATNADAMPAGPPSALRISSSTDRGIMAPPLLTGPSGSANLAVLSVRRSDSGGAATSFPSSGTSFLADTSRLIERCVSLLDSLLDETDEEADALRVAMHEAVARVALYRDVLHAAKAKGDSAASDALVTFERVFRPLIVAAHAAVRSTGHASLSSSSIAFDSSKDASVPYSSVMPEGCFTTLRINVLAKAHVPGLPPISPDVTLAPDATASKEDDVLYGPTQEATPINALAPQPSSAASVATIAAPPPLPPTSAVPAVKVNAFKIPELTVRVGAAERGGDLRASIAAALSMGSIKLMALSASYTASGALGMAGKMLAAAAVSSGADSTRVGAAQELKGWALGRSFADLGILDKAMINVTKPLTPIVAEVDACWSSAVADLLARSPDSTDRLHAALDHWNSCSLPRATASAFASLEADLHGMLDRFNNLPAQLLASSVRHIDTLLSIVDAFSAHSTAADDSEFASMHDGDTGTVEAGSGISVASKSWKLLCRLPTSKTVALAVVAAGDGPVEVVGAKSWDSLFPVCSPARLYYALLATLPRLPSMVSDAAAFPFPTIAHLEMPPPLAGAVRVTGGKGALFFHLVADGALKQWKQRAISWAGLDGIASAAGVVSQHSVHEAAAAIAAVAVEEARARERSFVAGGGLVQLVAFLRNMFIGTRSSITDVSKSPLQLAAASLSLRYLQRRTCAAFLVTGSGFDAPALTVADVTSREQSLRALLPFLSSCNPRIVSSSDAAIKQVDEGAVGASLQDLVLELLDGMTTAEVTGAGQLGSAALNELIRMATSAIFLWVPLLLRDGGALWDAVLGDVALQQKFNRVVIALVGGSGGFGHIKLCQRVQPVAVVALHSLCTAMPSAQTSSPSPSIDAFTKSGAPHPHGVMLQLLLNNRVTLDMSGPQAASVFYGFVEVLLRATLAVEDRSKSPLSQSLRRIAFDIMSAIQSAPLIETKAGARETAEQILKVIRASSVSSSPGADALLLAASLGTSVLSTTPPASSVNQTDVAGPSLPQVDLSSGALSSDPFQADTPVQAIQPSALETAAARLVADPLSACCAFLLQARAPLLRHGSHWNAVAPMHPLFMALGSDVPEPSDADAKAAAASTNPTTPLESALQRHFTLAGAATFEGDRALLATSQDEFVVGLPQFRDGSCVDTVLVGLLRLATVLVEADPTLASEVAVAPLSKIVSPSRRDSSSIDVNGVDAALNETSFVRFLFSTCLFTLTEVQVEAAPLTSSAGAAPLPAHGSGFVEGPLVRVPAAVLTLPKCKTLVSRRAALGLLVALTRRCVTHLEDLAAQLIREAEPLYVFESQRPSGDVGPVSSSTATPSKRGAAAVAPSVPTLPVASLPHRGGLQLPASWRLDPAGREDISATGYVGLRNLGCICYMNALMQQLFMVEPFRYGVLSIPIGEALTEEERKENTMYQLQRLFGHLELSERRHYDPAPWCHAYKDLDGHPTNTLVQQDAQEYITTLLDRVEHGFKQTPRAKLVEQVLSMTLKEARYCTGGCGSVRTSVEPHVCLTLEVTKGSLGAALDHLTAWEDVSDYDCDACKRRTTLRKRNTVGSLGHAIVIHLKRFEMNYETERTAKINGRFEFPEELDFSPYAYESLAAEQGVACSQTETATPRPREYYQYDLVGVIVHTGTLETGHYYSFIKERGASALARTATRPGGPAAAGRWLEFNDSVVSEFDSSRIPAECFGGTQMIQQWNAAAKVHVSTEVPVVKNAYMLVYERRAAQAIEVPAVFVPHLVGSLPQVEVLRESTEGSKRQRTASAVTGSVPPAATLWVLPSDLVPRDPATARGFLPKSIVADVLADNVTFARQCQQLDPDVAALWHLTLDAVSRQPSLLQRCLARGCELPPAASAASVAPPSAAVHKLNLASAAFSTAPSWLPDFSTAQSSQPPLDLVALMRAATLYCFNPLARSTFVDQVPHFAHTLARLVALHPGAATATLQWPLVPSAPGNLDLFRDGMLRNPFAPARGAFGRLVATAALTRLLLTGEAEASRIKKDTSAAAPWTAFAKAIVDDKEDLLKLWRTWEPLWGTLYDVARGGYGCGLPLVIWDLPTAAPALGAMGLASKLLPPPLGATKVDAAPPPPGLASALLAAWAEGRDAAAVSALSAPWASAPVPAPVSVDVYPAFRLLCRASHRARYTLVVLTYIIQLVDIYLGRHSTFYAPATVAKRPVLSAKGVHASWTRLFDLLALLVRSCFPEAAERVLGALPITALLWGPVPQQRHGSTLLSQYVAGSRPWPAPTLRSVIGAESDVAAALAARDEQVARSLLPRRKPEGPTTPSPILLPAAAYAIPGPAADDAALVRRVAESWERVRDEHGATVNSFSSQGFVDIDRKRHFRLDNIVPHEAYVSADLTVRANMPQEMGPPRASVADSARPAGITLIELFMDAKLELGPMHHTLLYSTHSFIRFTLGAETTQSYEAHFPLPVGPNPEAVAQILAHTTSYDCDAASALFSLFQHALKCAEWAEMSRPALLVLEPLLLLTDEASSTQKRVISLMSALWNAFQDALRDSKSVPGSVGVSAEAEKALELANAGIRLMLLSSQAFSYLKAVVKELEAACRRYTDDRDLGVHKLPAPLAGFLNAVTDSMLSGGPPVATPVLVPTSASKPDKVIPAMLYALSVLAGPVHRLPLRDELDLVYATEIPLSARAYIALQRLHRICASRADLASVLTPLARIQTGVSVSAPSSEVAAGGSVSGGAFLDTVDD